jgi:uncharacterized protein (TIGR04551 family)
MTGLGGAGLWPATGPSSSPESTRTPGIDQQPEERVLAEDWWSHARPAFELHGYFRTRAELFHNFALGRADGALWPRPNDNGNALCTPAEAGSGSSDNPANGLANCSNKSQAGANMRFRLDPELHISDNLRIVSQVDFLDNATLGSTPSGYQLRPAGTGGGYAVAPRSGYSPNGFFDDTIVPPASGVNSLQDSIHVKRVWAEYTTPVGQLRFGRMPDHFGLGMVHNSGDGYDDDYQSTVDRLQFITTIKPLDLYVGGSWDFVNEGPLSQQSLAGGQQYDLAQLDDVNQWSLVVMRKLSPELTKLTLSRGGLVVNGGAYVTLRKQLLANDQTTANGGGTLAGSANVPDQEPNPLQTGLTRRNATAWMPDLWLEISYKKFRFSAEGAAVLGSVENSDNATGPGKTFDGEKLRQYGLATQIEQKLVEDKLRLKFDFGWASGDSSAYNTDSPNNLVPQANQSPVNSDTISTFRFHPNYRIDLILFRNILQRVQGTYYFKPSVEYDFMRKPGGQRLGGGAGVIWSRASEFVQAPGHARDLGVELDGRVYFQSKDGSLNDVPGKMGGFYAMLEYGVLFPLAGLGFPQSSGDTSAAQILRMYLGALF